jgi:hypothetical protein
MMESKNETTDFCLESGMRSISGFLLSAIILSVGTQSAASKSGWSDVALGATVGDPQLVALTLETHQNAPVRLQANLSTIIVYSSVSGRVILIRPNGRFLPYGFAGGGVLHAAIGDWGTARGATGFVWAGVGLRLRYGAVALFGELGHYGGMDTSKGYEPSQTSYAVGFLYDL